MIKKYRYDILLISSLLIFSLVLSIFFFSLRKSGENMMASIRDANNVVLNIDLSSETKERIIIVDGKHEDLKVGIKHNSIRVVYSSCPHQDCVKKGSVSTTNDPIVCLYNKVYIVLTSSDEGTDIIV